jgi:DNA-binding HxlR family transcriptional regulator
MLKESEKPVHCKKCAVTHALEIIGGKWRLPIIWELSAQESMRYNELKRHLDGITNIMLTRALQGLEEHGLVRRVELCQIPPHVEYSLTESCKQLLPALEIINQWGKEQMMDDSCRTISKADNCPKNPQEKLDSVLDEIQ